MIDMEKFPALKSLNRLFITFFFVIGVTFNMVAPFYIVKAEDTYTYLILEQNQQYNVFDYTAYGNTRYTSFISHSSNDIRLVIFLNGQSIIPIVVSLDTFDSGDVESGRALNNYITPNTGCVVERKTYNDVSFYAGHFYNLGSVTQYHSILQFITVNTSDYGTLKTLAYRYAFGDLAVNPAPSIPELGTIEDVKYSTQINSHGDDSVDTISWYPYFDSNNNPAVGWNAQIRVVPGYYYDSDRDSLMQQAFNLFHKEEDQAELIYDDHFVQGSFSIEWGEVRNKISITSWQDLFGSLVSVLDGTYWYKRGWIYQIRIYDRDNDRYSEWQDVYTVTSSSGEGVENIIDPVDGGGSSDFYNNVENSFNTTSVVNNNYDVTYYYVNTPVNTNPSSDDSNEYLKEIRNNVIQIRRMISIDNTSNSTPTDDNNPWIGDPAAELYDFEDSSINDFTDAVGNLPTSDLITGNKFLAASTWVRTQYETIVSNTPFEAVIVFSLLLGFGLLLIGKLR